MKELVVWILLSVTYLTTIIASWSSKVRSFVSKWYIKFKL